MIITKSMLSIIACLTLSLVIFGRQILQMKKVSPTDKVIFITTVDCGYGILLAHTLIDIGCRVIGGARDPMAPSLIKLRESGAYLIKFDGATSESLRDGICRLKLRLQTWDAELYGAILNSGADAFGDFEWSTVRKDLRKLFLEVSY